MSRGIEPTKLATHNLCWEGPVWLSDSNGPWSRSRGALNFTVNSLSLQPSYTLVVNQVTSDSVENTPELWNLIDIRRYANYCEWPHTDSDSSSESAQNLIVKRFQARSLVFLLFC